MIRIVKATQLHLQQIDEIYNQAIDEKLTADTRPYSTQERMDWFKKHDPDRYPVFVYESDDEVAGWLSFSMYREGRAALRSTAEISYYVHSNHRGNGIGKALVTFALRCSRDYGFRNLAAIILERNQNSVGFIEHMGFKQWGYFPGVANFGGEICGHFYYGINI